MATLMETSRKTHKDTRHSYTQVIKHMDISMDIWKRKEGLTNIKTHGDTHGKKMEINMETLIGTHMDAKHGHRMELHTHSRRYTHLDTHVWTHTRTHTLLDTRRHIC